MKIYSIVMNSNSYEDYQYNSCVSKGICSINPRISALQTVLVLYLRLFAKYAKDLSQTLDNESFILNTIAITIYNPDFNEDSFSFAIKNFHRILPEVIQKYSEDKDEKVFNEEKKRIDDLFKNSSDILSSIKYGEKVFNRAQENISQLNRDLYNIMLVISKNLSINLLELRSFDKDYPEAFKTILNLLVSINLESDNIEALKNNIFKSSKIDVELLGMIRQAQEDRYGIQTNAEVTFSTIPNKAVLVVGSNIRELETVLEALKDENIDIYTHDDMMLAHTFPKFTQYKSLKGQFGFGLESCLLDFATFPGPIILTKNSLHNIENFYRGRLFTTDYTSSPKGIVKIEKEDFSQVIESAKSSKGFKKGRLCESINIGYNYKKILGEISNKIKSNKYNQVFIIAQDDYSLEQKAYFEKLIKFTPKDVLIISLSYHSDIDNLIYINSCYDFYSIVRIFEIISDLNLKITVFIPKCERNTIPQIIYFSGFENSTIYLGKCTPIVLNPSLMKTLKDIFQIKNITSARKNLEEILQ